MQQSYRRLPQHGTPVTRQHAGRMNLSRTLLFVGVVFAICFVLWLIFSHRGTPAKHTNMGTVAAQKVAGHSPSPSVQSHPSICVSNTLSRAIYVSISARHMWACNSTSQAYDSPVVTGMENIAADLTPTGTYHIYSKQTNLYLDGSDSTGSWHDYVSYWMPFLSNQYGIYGFHDATWRQSGDFGNISPYSSNASHGCVELPLETAKWVYNWAAVGTTVIVRT